MVNSVYAKAAVLALVNWNGKTEEEAKEIVATHTREEIEAMCYAEGSVRSGFEAIINAMRKQGIEVSEDEERSLYSIVLDGESTSKELTEMGARAEGLDRAKMAVDALTEIHDNWVRGNASKFDREDRQGKQYMHMPIEAIGWDAVELDYIFLRPVMESMGLEVSKEEVKKEYELKSAKFWCEDHPVTDYGFFMELQQPAEFYPALEGYPVNKFVDNRTLAFEIFDQINRRINKSHLKEVYADSVMEKELKALSEIDKSSMDERTFLEEVLGHIVNMQYVSLSAMRAERLKETLLKIGCERSDEWAKRKEAEGIIIEEECVGDGIARGSLACGVSFISQFLSTASNASFCLNYLCDGGEEYGWAQSWIRESKKHHANPEKESLLIKKFKAFAKAYRASRGLEEASETIAPETPENANPKNVGQGEEE